VLKAFLLVPTILQYGAAMLACIVAFANLLLFRYEANRLQSLLWLFCAGAILIGFLSTQDDTMKVMVATFFIYQSIVSLRRLFGFAPSAEERRLSFASIIGGARFRAPLSERLSPSVERARARQQEARSRAMALIARMLKRTPT